MRVFLTGATGFIGSAIVRELLEAGHTVLGLARGDESAAKLTAWGAEVQRGELTDVDSLSAGARVCDGVIHTAFIHDFTRFADNAEIDRRAIAAMAGALSGTGKALVTASGTALLPPGRLATERDAASTEGAAGLRAGAEAIVLGAAANGVRSSIVRLPPTVHGAGDKGFVPTLIAVARKAGFAAHPGDGSNRWPAVHRLDAARLFRLAVEKAAPGARLHSVGEEGIAMRTITETIGAGLGVPVRALTSPDQVQAHFGWFGTIIGMDNPSSSAITRETLGWRPTGPDLITDLRENGYFA